MNIISKYNNNNNNNTDFFANSDKKHYIGGFQHFIAENNIIFASENNGDKRDKNNKTIFNPFDNFAAFTIRKTAKYNCFSFCRNAGFCIYYLNIIIKCYYRKNIKKKIFVFFLAYILLLFIFVKTLAFFVNNIFIITNYAN